MCGNRHSLNFLYNDVLNARKIQIFHYIPLYTNSTAVLVLHQCREDDSALKYTVSSLFDPINKVESALSVVVRYTYHMPTTDSDEKDMVWWDKKTLIFQNTTTPLISSLKSNRKFRISFTLLPICTSANLRFELRFCVLAQLLLKVLYIASGVTT